MFFWWTLIGLAIFSLVNFMTKNAPLKGLVEGTYDGARKHGLVFSKPVMWLIAGLNTAGMIILWPLVIWWIVVDILKYIRR